MSFIGRNLGKALTQTSKYLGLCTNYRNGSQYILQPFTRSLSVLSKNEFKKFTHHSSLCSCGCGIKGIHTKGDRELVEFLQEEIAAEKKQSVNENLPSKVGEFTVKKDESELTLTQKFNDEIITVTLNVNHTVDLEGSTEDAPLVSKPDFDVDIEAGKKTISFSCQFIEQQDATAEQGQQASFGISEVTYYEGEWKENDYCVSADSLDPKLYDLFMNVLEERGIGEDFAFELSEICTCYEHTSYINILQNVQNFFKKN